MSRRIDPIHTYIIVKFALQIISTLRLNFALKVFFSGRVQKCERRPMYPNYEES